MEQNNYNPQQFSSAAVANYSSSNTLIIHNETHEAAMNNNNLPPGFRFCPEDIELVEEYLMKKVNDEELPCDIIREVKLYEEDPSVLTGRLEPVTETEWYFFTSREKKYPNGKRPNRAAAQKTGYWKPTGVDTPIRNGSGHLVGQKKTLDYYQGSHPTGKKTNWKMHEYKLIDDPSRAIVRVKGDMTLDDCVLCRVYRKREKNNGQDDPGSSSGNKAVEDHPRVNISTPSKHEGGTSGNKAIEDHPNVNISTSSNHEVAMVGNHNGFGFGENQLQLAGGAMLGNHIRLNLNSLANGAMLGNHFGFGQNQLAGEAMLENHNGFGLNQLAGGAMVENHNGFNHNPLVGGAMVENHNGFNHNPLVGGAMVENHNGFNLNPLVGKALLEIHNGFNHNSLVGGAMLENHNGFNHNPLVGEAMLENHNGFNHNPLVGGAMLENHNGFGDRQNQLAQAQSVWQQTYHQLNSSQGSLFGNPSTNNDFQSFHNNEI
ncbi:No apical meristem (NAM) protein [Corchorus olitorius]|uniref:No apical meristem (NAM) protein n=1 Tax=Corchorus olitorius TaxID=93759 RepID=A0A1R3GBZ1_9ROSI|nr:No apical meristem (NAM) protein [Corchorus olitorius]